MNEPESYKGICIGGPMDGKNVSMMNVSEFTTSHILDGRTKRHTYRHNVISFGGAKFVFWSQEAADPDWIMSELVKRYATR